jgi:hypothetical protein
MNRKARTQILDLDRKQLSKEELAVTVGRVSGSVIRPNDRCLVFNHIDLIVFDP